MQESHGQSVMQPPPPPPPSQLYIYGFSKIDAGPCLGGYYHPNFIRGDKSISLTLGRNQVGDRRCKQIQQQQQAALLQAAESAARRENMPLMQTMVVPKRATSSSAAMAEQALITTSSSMLPRPTYANNSSPVPAPAPMFTPRRTPLSEDAFSSTQSSCSSAKIDIMSHRNSSPQHGMATAAMHPFQLQNDNTDEHPHLATRTTSNESYGTATSINLRGDQYVQATSLLSMVPPPAPMMQPSSSSDFVPSRTRIRFGDFQQHNQCNPLSLKHNNNNNNNNKEQEDQLTTTITQKPSPPPSDVSSSELQWDVNLEPRTIEEMTQRLSQPPSDGTAYHKM
jgi:hypothetical protein